MATNPAGLIAQLLSPQGVNSFQDGVQQGQQQRQNQQALQIGAMQLQQAAQQQQQQQQYATDIQSYFDRGARVDDLAHLAAKYPQQAAALQKSYDLMDSAQKQSRLTQYGNLWNAAQNGRTELLINQLTALQKAEQAIPGTDTSDLDDALRGLQSNDPDQVAKATTFVKGIAQIHLAQDPDAAKTIGIGSEDKGHFHDANGNIYDDRTGEIKTAAPSKPEYVWDADRGTFFLKPGTGGGDPTSGGGASGGGAFDPHQFFKDFVLPHEGGYAAHDANGAPVNMGINQAANPDVDVRNLTPDQASDIFAKKYAAKAANLPPALAAAYSDTAYINPARADQFLQASGGDVNKFLAMRKAWQGNLVATQPDKYGPYAKAWATRNNDLAQYVQRVGSGGSSLPTAVNVAPAKADKNAVFTGAPFGIADNLSGHDVITALPSNIGRQVQAMLDGRQQLTARQAASPLGQQLIAAANQADPQFDTTDYNARAKVRNSFTSGPDAKNVTSLGTSINHMAELLDSFNKLQNGSIPIFNRIGNAWARATGNGGAQKAFNANVQAVSDELETTFRGSSGTLAGTESWKEAFDDADSPQTFKDVLHKAYSLLQGRADELTDKYSRGIGHQADVSQFLSPVAQRNAAMLSRLGPSAQGQNASAAPAAPPPPPGGKYIGTYQGRPAYQLPNGQRVFAQ